MDLLPVLLSYGAAAADNTTLQYYSVPPSGGQLLNNGTWTGVLPCPLITARTPVAARTSPGQQPQRSAVLGPLPCQSAARRAGGVACRPNRVGLRAVNESFFPAGVMGELTSERADIAAFPLSVVLPRPAVVDFSYSYLNGGIGILVRIRS